MEKITEQIPENLLYEEFGGRKYYWLSEGTIGVEK